MEEKQTKNLLVTLCGPSLSGKTILADLLAPFGFEEVVSTTTRPPRKGEKNGVNYHFVTTEKFQNFVSNNLMIEHVQFGENYYGLSREAFDKIIGNNKNGVAVVEPEGAKRIADYCEANSIALLQIFINNPKRTLYKRLFERYKSDTLANDDEYAKRAEAMAYEHEKWVKDALTGKQHYDKVFDSFDNSNQNEVIGEILQLVEEKLTKKKTIRKTM